jgi:hypothetical protein
MSEILIVSFAVAVGVALWLTGMCLYNPELVNRVLEWATAVRDRRRGPRATGLPIEELAVDLRRLLREHDRLVRPSAAWQSAHHLRACEMALHYRAAEAAVALGLPPSPVPLGRRTTADLARQLRQLAEAGLVLPETAGLGGDRW